jgi:hypothetical protein
VNRIARFQRWSLWLDAHGSWGSADFVQPGLQSVQTSSAKDTPNLELQAEFAKIHAKPYLKHSGGEALGVRCRTGGADEAVAFASDGIQKAAASLPHSKAPPGASLSISHRLFNPALLEAMLTRDS